MTARTTSSPNRKRSPGNKAPLFENFTTNGRNLIAPGGRGKSAGGCAHNGSGIDPRRCRTLATIPAATFGDTLPVAGRCAGLRGSEYERLIHELLFGPRHALHRHAAGRQP